MLLQVRINRALEDLAREWEIEKYELSEFDYTHECLVHRIFAQFPDIIPEIKCEHMVRLGAIICGRCSDYISVVVKMIARTGVIDENELSDYNFRCERSHCRGYRAHVQNQPSYGKIAENGARRLRVKREKAEDNANYPAQCRQLKSELTKEYENDILKWYNYENRFTRSAHGHNVCKSDDLVLDCILCSPNRLSVKPFLTFLLCLKARVSGNTLPRLPKDIIHLLFKYVKLGFDCKWQVAKRSTGEVSWLGPPQMWHYISQYEEWYGERKNQFPGHCTGTIEYYDRRCYSMYDNDFKTSANCCIDVPFTGDICSYIMCKNCAILNEINRQDNYYGSTIGGPPKYAIIIKPLGTIDPPKALPESEWVTKCLPCGKYIKVTKDNRCPKCTNASYAYCSESCAIKCQITVCSDPGSCYQKHMAELIEASDRAKEQVGGECPTLAPRGGSLFAILSRYNSLTKK